MLEEEETKGTLCCSCADDSFCPCVCPGWSCRCSLTILFLVIHPLLFIVPLFQYINSHDAWTTQVIMRAGVVGLFALVWVIYVVISAAFTLVLGMMILIAAKKSALSFAVSDAYIGSRSITRGLRRWGCIPAWPKRWFPLDQWLVYAIVVTLLFIEFQFQYLVALWKWFIIFSPILAVAPVTSALQGGSIEATFGKGRLRDPFATPLYTGAWMLPGAFELIGNYGPGEVKDRFIYKAGCNPNCSVLVWPVYSQFNNAPIILHIHGGAYVSGRPEDTGTTISYWLSRGYGFVSIGYSFIRRDPVVYETIEKTNADVEDGINYVIAHAAEWNMDPTRIVLLGESAGGGLVSLMGHKMRNPSIRGVVNMYGLTEWYYYARVLDCTNEIAILRLGLNNDMSDVRLNATSASTYIVPTGPPTLTIHGSIDNLVPIGVSVYFHQVLTQNNVKNMLITLDGWDHGCEVGWNSIGGQITRYAVERFLAAMFLPEQD